MISYFGVRHHGPGSTASLVAALDELCPAVVLVEGPADATSLLPLLADPQMRPPVALLGYAADDPKRAAFWPLAEFSPEYQAVRWALRHDVPVELIDLPVLAQLDDQTPTEPDQAPAAPDPAASDQAASDQAASDQAPAVPGEGTTETQSTTETQGTTEPDGAPGADPDGPALAGAPSPLGRDDAPQNAPEPPDRRDPISALAAAAGYEDPESWWNDLIEQNPAPGPIFAAVASAMTEYRAYTRTDEPDLRREAHMRRAIAKAAKSADGPVAVVCGALHVPALQARHTASADRALLTGLPRRSAAVTWAPWTNARLAYASGYGAGVSAP
ncbi:MAG: DUF5682 family protein, partial [Cellulomonas sp.]|nr:DUF5682 family protein [Cellulomonas sp.]